MLDARRRESQAFIDHGQAHARQAIEREIDARHVELRLDDGARVAASTAGRRRDMVMIPVNACHSASPALVGLDSVKRRSGDSVKRAAASAGPSSVKPMSGDVRPADQDRGAVAQQPVDQIGGEKAAVAAPSTSR